jgi:hypothetical protein
VVSLTATPDAGYGLRAWSGVCSGNGSCSVTLDADKAVGALFRSTLMRHGGPAASTHPEMILNEGD